MCSIVCKNCGHKSYFSNFCQSDISRLVSEFRPSGELPDTELRCPNCRLHVRQRVSLKWDGSPTKEIIVIRPGVQVAA